MLNILIQETDLFFQAGLQSFFDDFFKHNFHRSITFHLALTNENVSQADIIVLSLCQGETLTCFPELLARQKGIVIGLVDDELRFSALPSCFQDIIFLPRRASLDRISGVLFIAWFRTQLPGYTLNKRPVSTASIKGYPGNRFVLWSIFTGGCRWCRPRTR